MHKKYFFPHLNQAAQSGKGISKNQDALAGQECPAIFEYRKRLKIWKNLKPHTQFARTKIPESEFF